MAMPQVSSSGRTAPAFSTSSTHKNYFIFVGLMIVLVAAMLGWIGYARLAAFHQHRLAVGHESLSGVEKQVGFYIAEKQRMVSVFAEEQIDWLRALAENPNNDELQENLGKLLRRYFPKYFTFSITDQDGAPLFEDFDGLIGELCLADIRQFSTTRHSYHPFIHPNPEGYHFDIMVRYDQGAGIQRIFFVSFLADTLGDIIRGIQSPGHQIMLIMPRKETDTDMIEVSAEGVRNQWIRDDYRLSASEKQRITIRHDIPGTRWQVVDFHNTDLHNNFRNKLLAESSSIFLVFLTIAAGLLVRLRQEEQQRTHAEQQKQALMSVVSHEFRSPTSVIKGALDLVADGDAGKISEDVRKYIRMAQSNTSLLMRLVDDFLDLQKIESGNLSLSLVPTRLSEVVSETVARNRLYAEQFSVRYVLKQPLAEDTVLCDSQRIEQVLSNFLSNAAKYGAREDSIEVAVRRADKHLRVSVTDHGPGIPEEFLPYVFTRFAMAHAPHMNHKKGQKLQSSGLGLSIAKAIIERHGGNIGFDTCTQDHRGTGTTFWFELPVR
ncbi:MAG TPA: hypothetical protein ENI97_12720 [Gammaproteobacteria bacterium]|nr:hypothetical protein [Gammaproteobacteria bacterium]